MQALPPPKKLSVDVLTYRSVKRARDLFLCEHASVATVDEVCAALHLRVFSLFLSLSLCEHVWVDVRVVLLMFVFLAWSAYVCVRAVLLPMCVRAVLLPICVHAHLPVLV